MKKTSCKHPPDRRKFILHADKWRDELCLDCCVLLKREEYTEEEVRVTLSLQEATSLLMSLEGVHDDGPGGGMGWQTPALYSLLNKLEVAIKSKRDP